jgi:hypothetical protein
LLRELYETTTRFDEEDVGNSFLQVPLLDYVKSGQPRVLFVGYGETDNWAHQGRYDLVLDSAHRFDYFVKPAVGHHAGHAAIPRHTTFIITTDHGRGSGLTEWKEHGVEEKGSENIWIAVMGPTRRRSASARTWRRSPRRRSPPPWRPSSARTITRQYPRPRADRGRVGQRAPASKAHRGGFAPGGAASLVFILYS